MTVVPSYNEFLKTPRIHACSIRIAANFAVSGGLDAFPLERQDLVSRQVIYVTSHIAHMNVLRYQQITHNKDIDLPLLVDYHRGPNGNTISSWF